MIIVKTETGLKHFQKLFHDKSKAVTLEEKESIPLRKCYRATSYILPKGQEFLEKNLHISASTSSLEKKSLVENTDQSSLNQTAQQQQIENANNPHLPYYISMVVEPKIPFYEPKLGITKVVTISNMFGPMSIYENTVKCEKTASIDNTSTIEIIKLLPAHLQNRYALSNHIFLRKTRDGTLDAAKKRHAIAHTDLENYHLVTLEMEILTGRTHQIRYHLSQK